MQTHRSFTRILVVGTLGVALLILMLRPFISTAQSGSGYNLVWSAMAGGSGTASGGAYQLGGTVGQPETGSLSGGSYTLNGGFWGGVDAPHHVYLPIVLR